jgi:c-di-GMP-binding flagellar brake protein YcgR
MTNDQASTADSAETPSELPPTSADSDSPIQQAEQLDPRSVWGEGGSTDKVESSESARERRTHMRKGVRLNKLISAKLRVPDQEEISLYLHLVDISDGGMRVNGDIELSENQLFEMTLQTEAFGQEIASEFAEMLVTCRVVWQKRLLGGMFVSGLQFVDIKAETDAALRRILEICSPEGRRLRFRLNRVLGVGIGLDEETRWLYPLALDLSVEGMRVRLDEPLKVGDKFPLQIFLEFDLPTVQTEAEVVWKEEIGPSRYQIGLRFHNLNEESAGSIQSYIDRCLAKEMK